MADIPVEYRTASTHVAMPVWAGVLGLAAIAGLVWILFSLGASAAPSVTAEADPQTATTASQLAAI